MVHASDNAMSQYPWSIIAAMASNESMNSIFCWIFSWVLREISSSNLEILSIWASLFSWFLLKDIPNVSEHLSLQKELQWPQGLSCWYRVWKLRWVCEAKYSSHSKHLILWAWCMWSSNRCTADNLPKLMNPSLQMGHRGVTFSMFLVNTEIQLYNYTFWLPSRSLYDWLISLPVNVYLCF